MEDGRLQSGERRLPACRFRQLAETYERRGKSRPNPAAWRAPLCRRPKFWDTTARVPPHSRAKEMPDRASLAIRHLVDVSNQTKTELCVTVVSLSFDALSRSKVFTAYPTDDQLIHP